MRFGLIGCGGIGQLRAQALSLNNNYQLTAVTDLDQSLSQSLTAQYGGQIAANWRELIRRDDVDAVLVSTPPMLHAEMSIAALEAGKHVLCEKPLARTLAESQQMVEAAARHNRFLGTGFNYRFYPSMKKARELLDSGLIGELDHIRSYTGYSATDHNQAWLHDEKVMGGGALRDNGIHLIDLTCYFLGDVADIKGYTSNSVWGFPGCEDNGFALLRNQQNRVATLQASWTEWRGYKLMVEIYGSRGYIRASCFPMLTQVAWAEETGGPVRKKMHWFTKTQIMEKLRSYRWVVVQSFIEEFDAFAQAAQGQPSMMATGQDGLLAIEVAHRAAQ